VPRANWLKLRLFVIGVMFWQGRCQGKRLSFGQLLSSQGSCCKSSALFCKKTLPAELQRHDKFMMKAC
jgi:hypothetical protein